MWIKLALDPNPPVVGFGCDIRIARGSYFVYSPTLKLKLRYSDMALYSRIWHFLSMHTLSLAKL